MNKYKLPIIALMLLLSTSAALLTAGTSFSQKATGTGWKPSAKFTAAHPASSTAAKAGKVQCSGGVIDKKTKKPRQCLIKGEAGPDGTFYCWHHKSQE